MNGLFWLTGCLVWIGVAVGAAWLWVAIFQHAIQSFKMAARVKSKTAAKASFMFWWWKMFWNGPFTSLSIAKGGTIFWPGKEPKGWSSESGVDDDA